MSLQESGVKSAKHAGGNLRVQVLGPPRAMVAGAELQTADGRPLAPKTLSLLCFLALSRQPVARKELAERFWPGKNEANLRMALSQLRRCEGADEWLAADERVSVRAETDLAEFERHLKAGAFDEALALWGEPTEASSWLMARAESTLPEELAEFWLQPLRQHALTLYLEVLYQSAVNLEARGDLHGALERGLDALNHDPMNESALQRVMRLCQLLGEHQTALMQFERTRRHLEAEGLPTPHKSTEAMANEARSRLDALLTEKREQRATFETQLRRLPTPFIAREGELALVNELLRPGEGNLVSLVGPGGAGKSRLALEAARRSAGSYRDGVVFVPLEAVTDPESLPTFLCGRLNAPQKGAGDPLERLVEHLQGRQQLLILDNFEQLAEAAEVVDRLAAALAGTVLVTSRVPLGLRRERQVEVAGLDMPRSPNGDDFEEKGAIRLFLSEAKRLDSGFELSVTDRPALMAACEFVGGLPLYLEHLAGWTRTLTLDEIGEELQRGLELFDTAHSELPTRHQRLDMVLGSSWARLPDDVKKSLTELAHFSGGFTWEAAREVTGARLHELRAAVDAAFLSRDGARFTAHEAVRAYCGARREPASTVGERHAAHYLNRALAMAPDVVAGRGDLWREDYQAERGNYWQALNWTMETGRVAFGLELVAVLGHAWTSYSDYLEPIPFMEFYLERFDRSDPKYLRTLLHLGALKRLTGENEESWRLCEEALGLAQEARDERSQVLAHNGLGAVAILQDKDDVAEKQYEESLRLAEGSGDTHHVAQILNNLAIIANKRGKRARSANLYQRSVEINRAIGATRSLSVALGNLGLVRHQMGEFEAAEALYLESLELKRQLGYREGTRPTLANLGVLYKDRGDYVRASRAYQEALEIARQIGSKSGEAGSLRLLANIHKHQGDDEGAVLKFRESLELFEELGERSNASAVLNDMASAVHDPLEKRELLERSLAEGRVTGRPGNIYITLSNLAELEADDGDFIGARKLLRESFEITSERENHRSGAVLNSAAYVAFKAGEFERALRLFAYVDTVRAELGMATGPNVGARIEPIRRAARTAIGAERADSAEAAGTAYTQEEAVADALGQPTATATYAQFTTTS